MVAAVGRSSVVRRRRWKVHVFLHGAAAVVVQLVLDFHGDVAATAASTRLTRSAARA